MTLLRTDGTKAPEIWCRLDGGPHGFLSIAAHAHADALSVEVRYGGVDVLADPGTYCYHGEAAWRSYFRSTIAHNTVELDGRNQSGDGGPFLWLRHANGHEIDVVDTGKSAEWTADHDGYLSLRPPARHRRSVRLDRAARSISITDQIDGGEYDVRLAFHLGPDVQAELDGNHAVLRWPAAATPGEARLELPRSCGGACTGGKPIRSSGGTRPGWDSGCPRSRSSAAGPARPAPLSPPGWGSSTPANRKNRALSGQAYHSVSQMLYWERCRPATRSLDE